jgi:t-SNARE complex subunit (syntaxin)
MDWDSDEAVRRRFFKTILEERERSQQELLAIEQRMQQIVQELHVERQQLVQLRQSLDR